MRQRKDTNITSVTIFLHQVITRSISLGRIYTVDRLVDICHSYLSAFPALYHRTQCILMRVYISLICYYKNYAYQLVRFSFWLFQVCVHFSSYFCFTFISFYLCCVLCVSVFFSLHLCASFLLLFLSISLLIHSLWFGV